MDKVGRMLGLPFPAGSHIDALAQKYNSDTHVNIPVFPIVLEKGSLDFSFSGLKSAALREIERRKKQLSPPDKGGEGGLDEKNMIEISYGYQRTIMTILSRRLIEAQEKRGAKSLALVGGVSANSTLQKIMEDYSKKNEIPYYTPKSLKYCGDNAAMVGIRAYYELIR